MGGRINKTYSFSVNLPEYFIIPILRIIFSDISKRNNDYSDTHDFRS